jgi:hypothetical protein
MSNAGVYLANQNTSFYAIVISAGNNSHLNKPKADKSKHPSLLEFLIKSAALSDFYRSGVIYDTANGVLEAQSPVNRK